jgi:hypothetical protein
MRSKLPVATNRNDFFIGERNLFSQDGSRLE